MKLWCKRCELKSMKWHIMGYGLGSRDLYKCEFCGHKATKGECDESEFERG